MFNSLSGPGDKRTRQRGMRRRPRNSRDTLVLLDQPTADGMPGAPLNVVRRPVARAGRRGVAVAAGAVAAILVIAGTVALQSYTTPGKKIVPPDIAVVPTFPQFKASHTASPSPSPSVRPRASSSAIRNPAPTVQVTPGGVLSVPAVPIAVTYRVDSQGDGGFQGEIDVVNNEAEPISGWQIVLALPGDQFQSWWNATGFVSNGILLLYQPSNAGPLAAHGGTLHVFFVASGTQTTPKACAFDGVNCS